ncbi:MAG: carboxypeptidase regulatory-like domain-containing protein [Gemmatimonadetes bacterium]|nr:carboxypeptidase regulatory-like domain-containing protein [Gemmatimonadota bacterium]
MSVSGLVADSASRAPLVGAEIIVSGDDAGGSRSARTGANGRYVVAGIPAGQVTVSVRLVGFAPRAQRVTVSANVATTPSTSCSYSRRHASTRWSSPGPAG